MVHSDKRGPAPETGQAKVIILLALVALGALGGFLATRWVQKARPAPGAGAPVVSTVLSDTTKNALRQLRGTIKVDFYALLDLPEVSEATHAFAERVSQLLNLYEQEAHGKLNITRHEAQADRAAAARDGLRPIAVEEQAAAYLGVVLERNGRKEVLPQLSAEWEQALEPDLTRAIQRLAEASPSVRRAVETASDSELLSKVEKVVPNLETKSVEEGRQLLREAAVAEFKAAAQASQARLKEAQEQLVRAQASGSEAEQQAAFENLRRIQAEQTEQLEAIAARSEETIQAFERSKRQ